MNKDLVSFENTYIQTPEELKNDPFSDGALACVTIDGFPADEDGEGEVVCVVWLTTAGKFIVAWHHNGYRMNKSVLELVEDSKNRLLEMCGDMFPIGHQTNAVIERARDALADGHRDGKLASIVDLYAICHWEPMFSSLVRGLTGATPSGFVECRLTEMGLQDKYTEKKGNDAT